MGLPRIGIAACGGTIAATADGGGTATPRLGAADLLDAAPWLRDIADPQARTVMTKASPDITVDDTVRLHDELVAFVRDERLDGVVVTSGTDTLEEVAFTLDLLWNSDVPLVVTGAIRNASKPGADGPANLTAAVATAASAAARGLGALVVLNDQVHAARYARKGNSGNVAAFVSPTVGPLGYLAEGVPVIPLRVSRTPRVDPPVLPVSAAVALLTTFMGDDGALLPAVASGGFAGLVVAGFGGGHVPAAFAEHPAFAQLLDSVPVVLASRANAGEPLRATYSGFSGSETELARRGVISAGCLDAPKARVLLTLLAAAGEPPERVRAAFRRFSALP